MIPLGKLPSVGGKEKYRMKKLTGLLSLLALASSVVACSSSYDGEENVGEVEYEAKSKGGSGGSGGTSGAGGTAGSGGSSGSGSEFCPYHEQNIYCLGVLTGSTYITSADCQCGTGGQDICNNPSGTINWPSSCRCFPAAQSCVGGMAWANHVYCYDANDPRLPEYCP